MLKKMLNMIEIQKIVDPDKCPINHLSYDKEEILNDLLSYSEDPKGLKSLSEVLADSCYIKLLKKTNKLQIENQNAKTTCMSGTNIERNVLIKLIDLINKKYITYDERKTKLNDLKSVIKSGCLLKYNKLLQDNAINESGPSRTSPESDDNMVGNEMLDSVILNKRANETKKSELLNKLLSSSNNNTLNELLFLELNNEETRDADVFEYYRGKSKVIVTVKEVSKYINQIESIESIEIKLKVTYFDIIKTYLLTYKYVNRLLSIDSIHEIISNKEDGTEFFEKVNGVVNHTIYQRFDNIVGKYITSNNPTNIEIENIKIDLISKKVNLCTTVDMTEKQPGGKLKKSQKKKTFKKPVVSQNKENKYKEVLGKRMKIYKKPDSRKEFVRYKGGLVPLVEYKKTMKEIVRAKNKKTLK